MKEDNVVQGTLFPELEVEQNQKPQEVKTPTIKELQKRIDELEAENNRLKEKAQLFDEISKSNSLFTMTVIAKSVGKSAQWLNQYLQDKKVQYLKDDVWVLFAKYQSKGYTRICWYNYADDSKGRPLTRPHTYWTGKGLIFIRSLLKEDGLID
jgi:phage antirepressor YoqD-like protein